MSAHPIRRSELLVSAPRCDGTCLEGGKSAACSYRVAWSINPHMHVGAASPHNAVVQHDTFVARLRSAGARIKPLAFVHGAYDSVFVKDSALVMRRAGALHALLSRPRHRERRAEQAARSRALSAIGAHVHEAPKSPLEGGDVVLRADTPGAFLGTGFRSDQASSGVLEDFLGAPVQPLRLVDPRLYHLDMVLAILSKDVVLVCEDAIARRSMESLRSMLDPRSLIVVTLEEALRFAVNVVAVGRELFVGNDTPRLSRALHAHGYRTHVVPLGEFHHAGGSAACLVAQVHPAEEAVTSSTTAAMRSTAA